MTDTCKIKGLCKWGEAVKQNRKQYILEVGLPLAAMPELLSINPSILCDGMNGSLDAGVS